MADIFISYQHQDRAAAESLAARLAGEGYSAWWDSSLVAGDAWTETIRSELKAAKVVLVLWSNASWRSRWVQAEATAGHDRNCLVAVRLDDVALEPPFNIVQTADLRAGDGFSSLLKGIRVKILPATDVGQQPREKPVLAILPFDNLSNDSEMQFFSDGVTEEIHYSLSHGSGFDVIGRTSAFQFRGAAKKDAARELRVTHILDGAVRKSGNQMRVNAQLTDVTSGRCLWSDRFDRQVAEAFVLQDEIAAQVASALKVFLPTKAPSEPIDPAAYEFYLQGIRYNREFSNESSMRAESLLQQAVTLSPHFARAWAQLSLARALRLPRDRDAIGEPLHDAALAAVQRALELEPNNPVACTTLAILKPAYSAHGEKLNLMRRAIASGGAADAEVVNRFGGAFLSIGQVKKALPQFLRAAQLDPMAPWIVGTAADVLLASGQANEAVAAINAAFERMPNAVRVWSFRFRILFWSGRASDALEMLKPEAHLPPSVSPAEVNAYRGLHSLFVMGPSQRASRETILRSVLSRDSGPALRFGLCQVAAALDCVDLAYESLFEAFRSGRPIGQAGEDRGTNRAFATAGLFVGPAEALRRDVRFPRLCAHMGLVEYWQASGEWPDCADEVPYDFKAECEKAARA